MGCFDEIIRHINTLVIKYIKELDTMIKIYTLQVAKLVHSDSRREQGHTTH